MPRPEAARSLVTLHAAGFCAQTLEPLIREMGPIGAGRALDLRGHGERPAPADGDYSWSAQAGDVLEAVDALGLEEPIGFGHSAGGTILLDAEALRPGTFAALVCFEPPLWPGHPPPGLTEALAAGARRRRNSFPSASEAYDHLRSRPAFRNVTDEVLSAYVAHGLRPEPDGSVTLRCTPEAEAATYRAGEAHDGFSRLDRVRCPVTILVGDQSPPAVHALADIQAAALRSAGVVAVAGVGHLGPLEGPALVAASVVVDR